MLTLHTAPCEVLSTGQRRRLVNPNIHEEAARLQKPGVNWDGDFAPASLRAGPSPWGSASSISGSPRPISHQPWSQARPSGS